jgi:hypothetical protein
MSQTSRPAQFQYTPVANQSGTAQITVTVRDTGPDEVAGNSDDGIFSQTFTVTVLAPTVTIEATDANAAEANQDTGHFTITRTGNTNVDLPVSYLVSGTANYSDEPDYTGLPNFDGSGNGWVNIPAGSLTATITITPTPDMRVEDNETVNVALVTGDGCCGSGNYFVGTPSSAVVTIEDDPPIVTIQATDPTATEAAGRQASLPLHELVATQTPT